MFCRWLKSLTKYKIICQKKTYFLLNKQKIEQQQVWFDLQSDVWNGNVNILNKKTRVLKVYANCVDKQYPSNELIRNMLLSKFHGKVKKVRKSNIFC